MNSLSNAFLIDAPLKIESVIWDETVLVLSGRDWSFSTQSAWRILKETNVQRGCWDEDVASVIKSLEGLSVESITIKDKNINVIDPVFHLSDDWQLEVFVTDTTEPWVLRLSDKTYGGC